MTAPTSRFALAAAFACLVSACATPQPQTPSFYRDLARAAAVVDQQMAASMVSQYRANHGLGPVTVDPRLSAVALEMAQAMARADDVRASLRQAPLRQRLEQRGYTMITADENVSAGYRTLAEAFSGWRGSRPHDRVMKLPGATHLGIATVHVPGSRYPVYWALVMAKGR